MIVITGASDGIGLELAKLYTKAGKKVVNISRRESKFAEVNILKNLREGSEIKAASKEVKDLEDELESVINCIGVYTDQKFGGIEEDEVQRLMATNVKAPMMLISELLDLIKKDEADVLNVVSTAGIQPSAKNPLYVTSKWAEQGFSLSLQEELKHTNSRVISFCPGGIQTDLFKKAGSDVTSQTSNWMKPEAIALFIKQILDLPKGMEVSEVVIRRNPAP